MILIHHLKSNTQRNSLKIEGYQDGVDAGIKKEKQEITKKLLEKKLTIEEISEITSLSIAEINNLK